MASTDSSIAQEVWHTLLQEFSDVADASDVTRIVLRLSMAVLLGGIIGYERESKGKAAGLRTHMVVALGAALFVLVPLQLGMDTRDMSRIYQGVIAGIGFLGAGAIIKLSESQRVQGLTTAASIWLVAAIGLAAGSGLEMTAILATLIALPILALLSGLEPLIDNSRE